ncbi:MAG: hypothetical protein ABFE08_10705 [Armatimonadia bacterium]
MEIQYPSFSLRMLNLVIAMCKGDPLVPSLLCDLGYQEHWIEMPFQNEQGRTVVPEIIVFSREKGHTILWEWKKGNLKQDQMLRYDGVKPRDLSERAEIPPSATERHAVAVVTNEDDAADFARVLAQWKLSFPVLAKGPTSIRLICNSLEVNELNKAFSEGLQLREELPLSYVPFDRDTPQWKYVEKVGQCVISYMQSRQPRVELRMLCADAVRAWSVLSDSEKSYHEEKLRDATTELATNELRGYLRRAKRVEGRTHKPTWDIENNPLNMSMDRRTLVYRDLQKKMSDAVARLQTGQGVLPLEM